MTQQIRRNPPPPPATPATSGIFRGFFPARPAAGEVGEEVGAREEGAREP